MLPVNLCNRDEADLTVIGPILSCSNDQCLALRFWDERHKARLNMKSWCANNQIMKFIQG